MILLIISLAANVVLALGLVAIASSYIEQREFTGYLQSQNDLLTEQMSSLMQASLEYMEEEVEYDGHYEPPQFFN